MTTDSRRVEEIRVAKALAAANDARSAITTRAASDMLTALKEIAEGYTGGEVAADELRDIARRAVAKAEGRA